LHFDWTYASIMVAAVGTGFALFRRAAAPAGLRFSQVAGVALGAFCGSMIGANLPFVLADWHGLLSGAAWFHDGKTILAGLVGGYIGAELAEWALDVRQPLCDLFAAPVAAAVGIGRLACFHAGCCHGTVTSLLWGVDFGDGQPRHPTQLYEAAFHLSAAVALYQLQRRGLLRGHLMRLYLVAYFLFRFATEFIRPEERILWGWTGYQWAALALAVIFALWSCPGCRPMVFRRRRGPARKLAAADLTDRVLKHNGTLCPKCLAPLPGTTFQRGGRVYLRRDCPEHGAIESLVCSDRRHYYLRDEVPHQPEKPQGGTQPCCTPQPSHKSCVALLELTGQCNLRCPACYAASPSGPHRSFESLCGDLEGFLADRGPLDVLQLSGGEPLLHPDLLRIIDYCRTRPIKAVMVNTNGLALLDGGDLAAELASRRKRLELYLQFDGLDAESHIALRGADLLKEKRKVVETIVAHGIPTTLVCTVARGVNERQLGDLLRWGLAVPQIRGITYQPATWSGRFSRQADALDRVTLADAIRLLVEQSGGLLEEDDFRPLPCSNPNCCSFTYVARRRRRLTPLTRLVRYEDHIDRLSDRIDFDLSDGRVCCGVNWRPEDFFRVVVKPFMDAHTYDRDRVDECCIHVIRPGGRAVSFCHFNALQRGPQP
jgi:uncharacterized radical SAM superfamily Fe-S cluster-containing enzyme/prolipoprotein diacylglyceryltransferase